jgi:Heparinase II/III-like protein/Heparinase II/III N-terminus
MAPETALRHRRGTAPDRRSSLTIAARDTKAPKGDDIPLAKVRWYLSRLASMQPAEVLWRARSAATLPVDWARWKKQPVVPTARWIPLQSASYPVKLHSCGAPMKHVHIFDLEFPLGFEFDWHRDYCNGRQVERSFATTLNIRDTAAVSDIKYVWEPSRFQQLSALAFAANGEEHADYIVRSLDSWLDANPYLSGVNWTSSLELGERVISWAFLYPRIAEYVARDQGFRRRWLDSIYLHLSRITRKLSLYSSANNHLVGELVGLFVGSSCFNFWPECDGWRHRAQKLLEREIRLQVGEDGVNREQAMSYHLFTMELFLLAFAIGRNTGSPFSEEYAQRLRGMAGFLDAVATSGGDVPWYGDSDDARGFVLSEDESGLEVTMQLAGLLFGEPQWLRFGKRPTAAARALVPDLLPNLDSGPTRTVQARELFPDAGLACVHSDDNGVRLLMDFGPLGFTSIAAHGHSDALSLWLAIGDEYFLVDAGTYAYHSHPEWREFFRSTAAHNTASVDGESQSQMAGRFLWNAKANSRLLRFETKSQDVTIEAEHDGYARLQDPVIHRRNVCFDRTTGNLSIADSFECTGRHQVDLFFHMHEEAVVLAVGDGGVQVEWRARQIVFSSPDRDGHCHWEIVRGSESPMLGWRSRQFNQKQPTPTLLCHIQIEGPTTIRTHLRINS